MEKIREHIYLAALLHDIGKFYQREDKRFSEKQNELSNYSKKIANDICPVNDKGRFGYQHVIWTNEFLTKFESKLNEISDIKQNIWDNTKDDCLASFACNHHKPHSKMQALVTMADWWSAGIDRCNKNLEAEDQIDNDQIKWGKERYKSIPLYSIFNNINGANYQSAFSLNKLSLDETNFFPKEIKSKEDGEGQDKYAILWKNFVEEFEKLPTNSFNGFFESLLFLLKKYTWCIPSNTNDMSDVSLYDHLKTTASFVDCFFQFENEHPDDFIWDGSRLTLKDGVKPVLLIGGDLSGIQKFIYNIASRKAAVSLKGRSFYLQLLIDTVIQRIISHPDINTTIAQVVYSSGGKFYMLLPNTNKVRKALDKLKEEFENELWNTHNGQLILNIASVPFAYNFKGDKGKIDFENNKDSEIGFLWKLLADKLTEEKNQKFKSVLNYSMFEPKTVDVKARVCAVTGIESEDCQPIDNNAKEKTYVLPIVKEQVELGNVLKDADFIITHREGSDYLCNRSKLDITIFGIHNYLFDQKELIKDDADFRNITSADISCVKRINALDYLIPIKGQKVSYGFQFYGGNKQAQNNKEENKTFEELSNGTYLGILRMDVDNLGSIFIKGLPDSAKSFSAYSTLSFLLDNFFSGFLNTIRNKYKDDVNILYSGGDDVFAVGRWDKLIEFAEEIRKAFKKFVNRDDISISGGIAMVGDHFPIAKAAALAGDAEDAAKSYNNKQKNAFNMFGENVSWKEEFDFVKQFKNEFVFLCKEKDMPRSILHRLIILCNNMRDGDMSYIWHTAYFLKRFSDGKNVVIKDFCNKLKVLLCNTRNYELIAIAARWAELELRDIKGKKNTNN